MRLVPALKNAPPQAALAEFNRLAVAASAEAGKTLEAMTVWSDASQRILRELVELQSGAAKEGLRLCAEIQRTAMDTARDRSAAAARLAAP